MSDPGVEAVAPVSGVPVVGAVVNGAERGPTTGDPTVARSIHTTAVVTPEAVLLEYRAAGVASRLLAKVFDLCVQGAMFYGVTLIALVFGFAGNSDTGGIIVFVVGLFLVIFGYPMTEVFWGGATVGKKALGIRVITLEGGPIRFRHGAIRTLIWFPEVLIPPGGIVALSAALLTRRSQRIGDLAAGTVVIRSSTADAAPTFFAPARGAEEFSQQFDASRLRPEQYALIREFLLRAHHLTPEGRLHLAKTLTAGLERATGVERPVHVTEENYIVACTFAYQHRFGPTAPLAVPMAFVQPADLRPPAGTTAWGVGR